MSCRYKIRIQFAFDVKRQIVEVGDLFVDPSQLSALLLDLHTEARLFLFERLNRLASRVAAPTAASTIEQTSQAKKAPRPA